MSKFKEVVDIFNLMHKLFKSRDKPTNSTAGGAYRFLFGGSTSGKSVTERSSMQMTAVYSCVRILAEAVAGLPLHLGGLVGITLAADDDEWYYKTYELFTVDTVQANENKTLLTDVLTEGSSISVYGGYVAPTTATALTPVQEDDEWVLQARENASANENILQIVQTVDKDASYKDVLGGTTLYGEANGNQVIIQGTEKEKITAAHVAGGYTGGTHADSNTVSLANAEVTGSIIDGTTVLSTQKTVYGYDDDGDVTSTTPYTSALSFAAEGDQSAKGNTVSLANVSGGLVLGGMVMQGTAEGNAVTLLGGSQAGDAYGGISGIGAAKGNTVTISGSTAENVYGGAAGILGTDSASIRSALKSSLPVLEYDEKNNDYYGAEIDPEVGYISGTTFENIAVVPNAEESAISASGNTVNMVSGTVESIYGGYAADSLMDEAAAEPTEEEAAAEPTEEEAAYGIMSDEEDEGTTYESGAASDNTVNYYGGTVSQNIISGYSQSGEANNNTVNLYSGMLSLLGNLYGRYSESGSEGSGNTLNVYTKGNSTGNLDHFQSLNFYVPKETTAGETMLTVTGQADVSGAVITADPSGIESLKPGETVGLIHGDNDITAENTTYGLIGDNHITDENFISYTMDIAKQDSNNIVIYIPENSKGVINPDTKLLPESREAATAALKNSASMGNSDTVQSSAAVIAGGISGAGDANRNTLSFSSGSVSELAVGGFSDYGGASDNSVTISGGSVYKLAGGASVGGVASLGQTLINDFSSLGSGLSYKGTTGGSTENNRVTMSGGSATYVWGAYNWNLTGTEGNVDVIGNQVTISDTAVVNGQVVGGEADAGSADNNAVIIKGGIINGAASGSGPKGMSVIGANTNVSGSGGANTNNSVTISGGTFGETAVAAGNRIIGAYSQSSDENISGNSVKISGGTFGQAQGSANFVYGAYDLGHGSTISKNSVAISGGTLDAQGGYDILIGAYIDVDGTSDTASENSVSLTGGSIGASGSADTLQIKGAQINENGTASGNSVEINGADIGSTSAQGIEVEGGIVKTGAASENKVTISSGTLNTSSVAALQLFGGFVQSSGDVTGNDINVTGGTIGKDSGALYLYGGYTASGNAAENKVEVSGAALNPNAVFVGAFTGSGDASGNTVSLTGQTGGYASAGQAASGSVSGNTAALDGSTATLVYNGRIQTAGTSSGNKVTLSNNSAAGAAYGGYSPSGDVSENTVDVESGSFANNAIGGWTNSGNATGNKAIVNDSKIGSDTSTAYVFGGYSASGEASGSKVTVTNSMLGSKTEVYGGYGTTGSSGSSVTFTGSTGGSLITGGYTRSGSASKNTLGVQDGTVNGSITGGQTGTGDAASNTVNMSVRIQREVFTAVM